MSLKEAIRPGESGGRKAAVREVLPRLHQEQLPSQHPLPKPTRDVSASNRSHSLTHDDPPLFPSHRRLLLADREAEEAELEKQANVVYTRQFRTLAKLLGNEGMDFEELREKVEGMVLADRPAHDPQLLQRIQTLEWELARRAAEVRSSQTLPASQEYLRGLETELGRKSKMINEFSDSVKRDAFEDAVRGLQAEIEAKTAELKAVEEQAQEARLRTNASLSLLEEELVRHKQTIQKLTFELDSQKRRAQTTSEDVERLKRREKELLASLESEGKASYQGLSYSPHALLLQLEARDQELSATLAEHHALQQELNALRRQQLNAEEQLRQAQQEGQAAIAKLAFEETQKERLLEEIEQVTRELRLSNQAVASASAGHQTLLAEKERSERQLREAVEAVRQMEAALGELRAERDGCLQKMGKDEEMVGNMQIQLQQARRETAERNQELESQLAEWSRTIQTHQEEFLLRDREVEQLRSEIALREEEFMHKELAFTQAEEAFTRKEQEFILKEQGFTLRAEDYARREEESSLRESQFAQREEEFHQQFASKTAEYEQEIESLRSILTSQEGLSAERLASLSSRAALLEEQLHGLTQTIASQSCSLAERESQVVRLEQRIEAFEEEKELLLHRLDLAEQEQARASERERHWEEMARGRPALEAELSSREAQEHQLRVLLEQAAGKEAQLEAELYQRELQLREGQEERRREHGEHQAEVDGLRRCVEELQEQAELERRGQEGRAEEEGRLREEEGRLQEELEQEVRALRLSLAALEERQQADARGRAQLESTAQRQQAELAQQYAEERAHTQHLLQQNDELRVYHQQLTAVIEQHNHQMAASEAREAELERQFHAEMQQLQAEVNELKYMIEELKAEKAELEKELEAQRRPRDNELASFTFNQYEAEHHLPAPDLRAIIEELEQKLDGYKREEEERIRLSYSNTLEGSPALLGSLHSERDCLQAENRRLEQELGEAGRQLQALQGRLEEFERLLQEQEAAVGHLAGQLEQQTALDGQRSEELARHREEHAQLLQRYQQEKSQAVRQEEELLAVRAELQRVREARELQTVTQELERTKGELGRASQEIARLRAEIAATFQQLEATRQEAQVARREVDEMKLKAQELEHRVSELEERRKREGSEEPHRVLSRLSKRSNVSEQELEEARSKGSSDGELSRRILNDPSKISGQESKFAHHLLVFENSKIHVAREAAEIAPEREIKEQRHEESVLSRQQQENRTPDSSHRQINTTHTHFDRPSNDNSRREARESQQFSESRGSPRESMRQSNHSLTSIRQAEEVQEGSLPPAAPSSVSSLQKEAESKPKEYLPQHSSKRTISNNESKQSISQQSSKQSASQHQSSKQTVSQNEPKQNVVNHSQSKQSVSESQPHSFQRNSYQANVPIYIARPSPLLPQERRESSQSQSGSKTKVRISYGQAAESVEIRRREVPREMASSQVSRVSMQSNKLAGDSMHQASPIDNRPSEAHQTPSLLSSQRREQHSRPSLHAEHPEPPSDSIIHGINQLASRISTHPNPRISNTAQLPRHEGLRRESSPVYVQARIDTAHSPRHSNFISFNSARSGNPAAVKPEPAIRVEPVRQEARKEELTVPASKIVMRSVIGGKRNSLLNDTATFGKSSLRGPLNETVSESNDSGIDVLQLEWPGACCKNS